MNEPHAPHPLQEHDTAYCAVKWRYLIAVLALGYSLGGACQARGQEPPPSTVVLRTDQVRPSCTKREAKRWARDIAHLTQEQQSWMRQYSHSTKQYDFTGDGVLDTLEIIATQSVRECDVAAVWQYKEIHVTLQNGATGKKQLWNWQGGLPQRYTTNTANNTLILRGTHADSSTWEKTLTYNR